MAVLTYGVYNDPTNNTPALLIAYNSVNAVKILQIALDPVINYAVIYPALAWLSTYT